MHAHVVERAPQLSDLQEASQADGLSSDHVCLPGRSDVLLTRHRYKAQELQITEDVQSQRVEEDEATLARSIYSGISQSTLKQIKSIDLSGSFGTKIDTRKCESGARERAKD